MGKTYLRYDPADTFGVIASSAGGARAVLLPASTALARSVGARAVVAAAPAIDTVLLWHVRHGTVLRRLADPAARATAGVVTALAVSADGRLLAAGHADGSRGLFRLHAAHTDAVTSLVLFDGHGRSVVSASKDGLVRVWDAATQHCVQTVVGHRGAIWGAVVDERQQLLVTASADEHLRVFAVGRPGGGGDGAGPAADVANGPDAAAVRDVTADTPLLTARGSVTRKSIRGRAVSVAMVPVGGSGGAVLAVHANERAVELFARTTYGSDVSSVGGGSAAAAAPAAATTSVTMLVQQVNNCLEAHKVPVSPTVPVDADNARIATVDAAGHRGAIRGLALSPDGATLLSAAACGGVKFWDAATASLLRSATLPGRATTASFLPGDPRYALVGTDSGGLFLLHAPSAAVVGSLPRAHGDAAVWSVVPAGRGGRADAAPVMISGGSDKTVKFWDLLVSLLDATVRRFDAETLTPLGSLYGHALPVTSMSTSSDGVLVATASADRTVKVWGLDFGDCRRSLRAHTAAATAVVFQPATHYLFTGGRDGAVRYWDADTATHIADLEGHRGDVAALLLSGDGELLASASADGALRTWRRTDAPLFPEEEAARRADAAADTAIEADDAIAAARARGGLEVGAPPSAVAAILDAAGEALSAAAVVAVCTALRRLSLRGQLTRADALMVADLSNICHLHDLEVWGALTPGALSALSLPVIPSLTSLFVRATVGNTSGLATALSGRSLVALGLPRMPRSAAEAALAATAALPRHLFIPSDRTEASMAVDGAAVARHPASGAVEVLSLWPVDVGSFVAATGTALYGLKDLTLHVLNWSEWLGRLASRPQAPAATTAVRP
ncbi:hypothetical protein I4F81_010711 [Pyropia yezoensis]|uniref:Uncharacterized protein n=1 Tax=Pyropia yezoensis TaxID=2788 RepID=A0ACC3CDG7_PYRYE|nr:hypothetical protein I4F81_010711 [Neopyropia yezoensis]